MKKLFLAVAVFTLALALALAGCGGKDNPVGENNTEDPNLGSFVDARDDRTYKTVKFGGLIWMAENLKYPTTDSSWCYGNNCSAYPTHGRLYAWNAAKSACPTGWYLPSRAEWNALAEFVGGAKGAGKKLKSKEGWNNKSGGSTGNGTDEYGFSGVPGGYRNYSGSGFDRVGKSGMYWSATEVGDNNVYNRELFYDGDDLSEHNNDKRHAFAVRCVKQE